MNTSFNHKPEVKKSKFHFAIVKSLDNEKSVNKSPKFTFKELQNSKIHNDYTQCDVKSFIYINIYINMFVYPGYKLIYNFSKARTYSRVPWFSSFTPSHLHTIGPHIIIKNGNTYTKYLYESHARLHHHRENWTMHIYVYIWLTDIHYLTYLT